MKHLAILSWLLFAVCALAADLPFADARDQISALRREIARHDELYHRENTPEIGDAEYDSLKQRLAALERAHPGAAELAVPLAELGDDRSGLFETRRHGMPMMSLAKAYAPADLRAFHARLAKTLGRDDLEFVVEPKYDGLAISLTYEQGELVRALTRGNGAEGDDITANVRQIPGLAHALRFVSGRAPAWPERVELRGEIYVPHPEFRRVNEERDEAGEPVFASPRSLAAGAVRQLDVRDIAQRGVRIVIFALGECEPETMRPTTQRELRSTLREWGLPVPADVWTARGADEMLHVVEQVGRARSGFDYPTDGAVIKLDSVAQQREAGEGRTAPRWAVAYKFISERVETELRAITLQVGRSGVLTPVAELVPVQLAGSKIARATLHNRAEIARRDIRVGDFVYIEKAGSVIPAVIDVNRERRPAAALPFEFPLTCPACHARLIKSASEASVFCPNYACPAQVQRRVEHFASKACLDIDGLGPATIRQLVDNGWVKEPPDLYRLRRDALLTLRKSNEKSVDRLLAGIEASKRAELWRVINGMGLPQIGAASAKDLARQCGSLARLAELGPNAAAVLGESRYQRLIAELIAVGLDPPDAAADSRALSATAPLAGKVFVLTGRLPQLTRAQAIGLIEAGGGTVTRTPSQGTHFAVIGEKPGATLLQARELGITMLDEAALLQMIEGK